MIDDAIKKITDAEYGSHGEGLAKPIADFIVGKCEDEEFAALVMQEHKTLEKCLNFVMEQAKNHLNNKCGYIPPDEVFSMVNDYFTMDDAELERKKAEEAAMRKEEAKRQSEERAAKAAEAKTKKAAEKKAAKQSAEGQISLFS